MTEKLTLPAFGDIDPDRVVALDDLFAVIKDKYPISPGHSLIVARRPTSRFQELSGIEKARLLTWIDWTQQHLATSLSPAPDAFNLGLNDGPAAGQTIAQLHFHIIPRYEGDVPDPRGGIRHVVPSKAPYWKKLSAQAKSSSAGPSALTNPAPTANGLSVRATRCLVVAGIPVEKKAVIHALKTGALYPFFRPTLYGKTTHREVCRWAGLDESFVAAIIPEDTRPPVIENVLQTVPHRQGGEEGSGRAPSHFRGIRGRLAGPGRLVARQRVLLVRSK